MRLAHGGVAVALFVEDGAEKTQALQTMMPDHRAVLAHAAGERDRIDTAHNGRVRTQVLADAVGVKVDRQPATLVAFAGTTLDIAQIVGAGEARQAGAVVEKLLERIATELARNFEQDAGVEI